MVKSYMNKFKEQLIHFMRGRYGGDLLNNVLLWVLVIFQVLNIFLKNPALHLLINMIFVYALYRIMSKNIWARQKENLRFYRPSSVTMSNPQSLLVQELFPSSSTWR